MTPRTALPLEFYERDVESVARDLLGRRLVRRCGRKEMTGWIVEVEAYRGFDDPASHAFRGRTPRNSAMFGPAGRAYVYTIHAKFCLNAIADTQDSPCGILIRAVEPERGLESMRQNRRRERTEELTSGPARLCQALSIEREFDHWDLTRGSRLWIDEQRCNTPFSIAVSPRIGVSKAKEAMLRFFVDGNRCVSGPRHWHTQPKHDLGAAD